MSTLFGSSLSSYLIRLTLLDGMIIGFLVFLVCYFLSFRKKHKSLRWNVAAALLFLYTGALFALTIVLFLPASWQISAEATNWVLHSIQIEPLQSSLLIWDNCRSIGQYGEFIRLIGGNFILLVPLAVLVPLMNEQFRLLRISLLVFAVSLSIELLQLLNNILRGSPVRTVEIDDILLNVSGGIVGYLIFAALRKLYRMIVKPSKRAGKV